MNWYAIYTKPKAEDIVSKKLRQVGIEIYNPKLIVKKYIRKQYRDVIEPLFPCYVFGKFDPDAYLWRLTYTQGIRRVVGGKDSPWPVPEEIIEFIRFREEDGFITIRHEEMREGDTVRIADGPLSGMTGIFRKIRDTERVILLLNAIEYQARVIVERASLRKVC